MVETPDLIRSKIKAKILKDMDPPIGLITSRSALAVLLGGGLSLVFCGQFGVALTPLAAYVNHFFHIQAGSLWCSVYCGAIFSLAPILMLRFLTSRFQFLTIMKKWRIMTLGWMGIFGFILYSHGAVNTERAEFAAWFLTMVFAALLMVKMVSLVEKVWLTNVADPSR